MSAPKKTGSSTTLPKRTQLALWLMIGPSALLLVSIIGFAIANALLGILGLLGSNTLTVVVNISLYLIGSLAVVTLLPGLIAGIILLATKK